MLLLPVRIYNTRLDGEIASYVPASTAVPTVASGWVTSVFYGLLCCKTICVCACFQVGVGLLTLLRTENGFRCEAEQSDDHFALNIRIGLLD